MIPRRAVVLSIALAAIPSLAHSQLCSGSPSFSEGRYRISGSASLPVGLDEANPSYSLALSVNFGRKE